MTPSKKPAARPAAPKAPKDRRAEIRGAKGDGTKGAPPKPAWDISDIEEWGPNRHELGAVIPEAGNSIYNETGSWRTFVPEIDVEKCIGCMLCYFYCPDAAIIVEGGKAVAVDLAHCKGCGICAHECPPKAITMLLEEKE
jgi:2-oxoacid:acceptor oxidoreductase delta subunit (pyruvate/2-ketoisovalerate family)